MPLQSCRCHTRRVHETPGRGRSSPSRSAGCSRGQVHEGVRCGGCRTIQRRKRARIGTVDQPVIGRTPAIAALRDRGMKGSIVRYHCFLTARRFPTTATSSAQFRMSGAIVRGAEPCRGFVTRQIALLQVSGQTLASSAHVRKLGELNGRIASQLSFPCPTSRMTGTSRPCSVSTATRC